MLKVFIFITNGYFQENKQALLTSFFRDLDKAFFE